jgi:hypothetical protein
MLGVFRDLIGRIVEAYVDDIVVKSREANDLITDLDVAFRCLKKKNIKLNPEKCVFDVPQGTLLGFIVSERGIEANLEKISAIANIAPIRNLKGVQKLMGCLTSLSRFISRLGEKGLALYHLLKKSEHFSWTPEAQEALDSLKVLLSTAHVLVPPSKKGAPLAIRRDDQPGGQRGHRHREKRGGAYTPDPTANLLRQ